MDIGIGLPSTIPGTPPEQIVEWAKAAERAGFSSLGVIDRLVYGNTEPLVTLAAVATVTERIKLMTSILLVPFRANAALLAKQAATVNHMSGGRLVLGMAVGGYEDDYRASGVPFSGRGQRFDEMLDEMTRIWDGDPQGVAGAIGPVPGVDRSQIIFGGGAPRTFQRVAARGAGWIAGSRGVDSFRKGAEAVRRAWAEHGREGRPRLLALPYFSLGPRARENAETYLSGFYAIEGAAAAPNVVARALTGEESIRRTIAEFEAAGCDELMLFPCDPDPDQVHRLAEAIA